MGMPVIVSSGIERCQSVTDIIQSVALEQAALAHILNAEGEKIQRIVADTTVDTDTIMETNESVQNMVETIAQLEMILKSKLGMFKDCLCVACEGECDFLTDVLVDGKMEPPIVNIVKVDKNNWIIEISAANGKGEIQVTPTPNTTPIEEVELPANAVWNADKYILVIDGTTGPVKLAAKGTDCDEIINIEFVVVEENVKPLPEGEVSKI